MIDGNSSMPNFTSDGTIIGNGGNGYARIIYCGENNTTTFDIEAVNEDSKIKINAKSNDTILKKIIVITPQGKEKIIYSLENEKYINTEYIPTTSGIFTIIAEDIYGNVSQDFTIEVTDYSSMTIFEMPILTSNDCTIDEKRYILSSSSDIDSDRVAFRIFDGSPGNCDYQYNHWHSGDVSMPQWVQIQFPMNIQINKFTIQNREADTEANMNFNAKDFIFQGSNNGEEWENLGEFTINLGSLEKTSFEVANPNGYIYYRWYITSSYSSYVSIGEITLDEAFISN